MPLNEAVHPDGLSRQQPFSQEHGGTFKISPLQQPLSSRTVDLFHSTAQASVGTTGTEKLQQAVRDEGQDQHPLLWHVQRGVPTGVPISPRMPSQRNSCDQSKDKGSPTEQMPSTGGVTVLRGNTVGVNLGSHPLLRHLCQLFGRIKWGSKELQKHVYQRKPRVRAMRTFPGNFQAV